jgi:hypothetical protein
MAPAPQGSSGLMLGRGAVLRCRQRFAETAAEIRGVLTSFKQFLMHFGFAGRICTRGNIAIPITPPELGAGDAYRFSLCHLMEIDNEADLFPVRLEAI